MGLSASLSTVLTALHSTQRGLDVVAGNIANADTAGYTRKSLSVMNITSGLKASIGVRVAGVQREIDLFVQTQYRESLAAVAYSNVRADYSSRLDEMFGRPGEITAFDSYVNAFTGSLETLSTTPEDPTARTGVINEAMSLAQRLQAMSSEIQTMRADAEQGLADGVSRINELLQNLESVNSAVVTGGAGTMPPPDMLDDRDRIITELSTYMDIRVLDHADNSVTVMTQSGFVLFDRTAASLGFDARPVVSANATWSRDPAERELGTITLNPGSPNSVDLIANGAFRSGALAGLINMRDNVLVDAQAQLDEFAHTMALALSNRTVDGVAATVGAQDGFDLDINDMLAGNEITLTYASGGTSQTVRFLRVDDPSKLPLDDSVTADPNDQVFGIDFSGGTGSVVTQIATALGASFTVSDEGGGVIRILDDGAAGTIDIDGLSASVTNTVLTDEGTALPLFVDGGRGNAPYTGSLDGEPQKIGIAGRITVNPDLIADSSKLVVFETGPDTPSGDATRPNDLLARLTDTTFAFSPETGIGGGGAAYTGTVASFARQIISHQGSQAANFDRLAQGHEVVSNGYRQRLEESSKVNVDEEMAHLVRLQNAYAANARVMSVIDEMMQTLLAI